MIFCFSGTGNSYHVAERISQATNEKVILMTESERRLHKEYSVNDQERIGFVFPIYWGGMPLDVKRFIEDMKIKNYKNQYTYAIATYGLLSNNGLGDLRKQLKEKEMNLQATFEVKMVDNYIVGYELAKEEKQNEILTHAEKCINRIVIAVNKKESASVKDYIGVLKPIVHMFYETKDHRKKFYVTDKCVGCKKCESECPSSAIKFTNGKPMWVDNCSFCQHCIHCCPKQAVQWGKTEGRTRYYYPGIK